jgi:glycine cleavage system regulatory protein
MTSLVLTILAKDREGLVESLAAAVRSHGGNWLESRMVALAGQFAGLLRVVVPDDRVEAVTDALRAIQGLDVLVRASRGVPEGPPPQIASLDLVGPDRPGIVHEVTRVLAECRVSVEEIETRCVSAPMTGEPLFEARARLRLPSMTPIETVTAALEAIAADLMVAIKVAPLKAAAERALP